MKGKIVSQISYSTNSSKDIQFKASSKSQINVDELLEKEEKDSFDIYNFDEESEEEL